MHISTSWLVFISRLFARAKYTPPAVSLKTQDIPPKSHIYMISVVSYCSVMCLLLSKDPYWGNNRHLCMCDSLLIFRFRVRHDGLECKRVRSSGLAFNISFFSLFDFWILKGHLIAWLFDDLEVADLKHKFSMLNSCIIHLPISYWQIIIKSWPGCLRWWSKGSQTWHWWAAR